MSVTVETDDLGIRRWTCDGWTLTTWPTGATDITAPGEGDYSTSIDVRGDDDGLFVISADFDRATGIVIPFPVLREILRIFDPT